MSRQARQLLQRSSPQAENRASRNGLRTKRCQCSRTGVAHPQLQFGDVVGRVITNLTSCRQREMTDHNISRISQRLNLLAARGASFSPPCPDVRKAVGEGAHPVACGRGSRKLRWWRPAAQRSGRDQADRTCDRRHVAVGVDDPAVNGANHEYDPANPGAAAKHQQRPHPPHCSAFTAAMSGARGRDTANPVHQAHGKGESREPISTPGIPGSDRVVGSRSAFRCSLIKAENRKRRMQRERGEQHEGA